MQGSLGSLRRLGLVSAYPPLGNSLSEFGGHLADSLARQPEVSHVRVFADGRNRERLPGPDDATLRVEPTWEFNDPLTSLRILRATRRAELDALLFNIQFATFGDQKIAGGLGLVAPALSMVQRIPVGVVLHNLVDQVDLRDAGFASNRAIAALMEQGGRALTHALLRADYVAVTIPAYAALLRERYRARNVVLIPHGTFDPPTNGVPLSELDRRHPGRRRRIVAFGKWGTYKRLEDLLAAHRDLVARGFEDLELVVAGTDSPNAHGYLDTMRTAAEDLPGVRFTGYVAEADVAALFESASISVFPYTSTTGSSGVLHQAAGYGCAFVLPHIGDFAEILAHEGYRAETFEPADALSLADSLAKLLENRPRQDEMGEANRRAAAALPLDLVAGWHLLHLARAADRRRRGIGP